jgi:predicted extracellular nuclease
VVGSEAGTRLSFSPGRVDPANSAFTTSRKPLAGEFSYQGHHLFVVANHFNSKGGDQPPFGRFQPPARGTEVQRNQQARVVHDFVAAIEAADRNANVVVLGDFNDFEFSTALGTLRSGVLRDLITTPPREQRHTYDFEGNSQTLDHVLLSRALADRRVAYDVVTSTPSTPPGRATTTRRSRASRCDRPTEAPLRRPRRSGMLAVARGRRGGGAWGG